VAGFTTICHKNTKAAPDGSSFRRYLRKINS
jgi:hypothetical protein